jgi:hypothetical protein
MESTEEMREKAAQIYDILAGLRISEQCQVMQDVQQMVNYHSVIPAQGRQPNAEGDEMDQPKNA